MVYFQDPVENKRNKITKSLKLIVFQDKSLKTRYNIHLGIFYFWFKCDFTKEILAKKVHIYTHTVRSRRTRWRCRLNILYMARNFIHCGVKACALGS